MDQASFIEEVFIPQVIWNKGSEKCATEKLEVIFLDRATKVVPVIPNHFEVLVNANSFSVRDDEPVVGIVIWWPRNLVYVEGYREKEISIEALLGLLEKYAYIPPGVCFFREYRERVYSAVKEYNLFWQLPKF